MRLRSRTTVITSLLLLVEAGGVLAQSESEVLAPIHQLFDGMREADTAAVRAAFAPMARLIRTLDHDGQPTYRITSIDDFVEAVGQPHEEVWDEQIWDVKSEVHGNLASVWMKYVFFRGEDWSHCGVNSAELLRTPNGWRIMHLADTAQREDCEMPPNRE